MHCFLVVFKSISFAVTLQIVRPLSRYRPTSFLNLDAIKDSIQDPINSIIVSAPLYEPMVTSNMFVFFLIHGESWW